MAAQFGTHRETGDAQRRQAQYHAAFTGGLKGAGGGFAAALPTAYLLNRSWAPFRGLTLPLKAFFVTMITVASGVITADKAGLAFERAGYSDAGAKYQKSSRTHEEREWDELSTRDKMLTWTKENKFSVVAGSWVASMCGSFAYIQTQPMSFAQKLVQARVYAQALTLASLVGMAALTSIPSAGDRLIEEHAHAGDHSWRDMIHDDDPSDSKGQGPSSKQSQQKQRSQQGKQSSGNGETQKEE